ncbi:Putative Dual specificity phosphatase, catalytic domain protein [Penicillium brasilianum]|uniref:Putative Dual specificity phosphatase, catalytic domain protein n=1 Tax=Penicillium brasilianum TaxID=104259 RepID=A0A0F7VFE4_PENBI|nr:Putative Dual specificity phosphatase, catalytic domain protein [Penicillium brasilianum]
MRQIVPGLFLGNVEASYKREMLQENHINAIVSLTDARWVCWNSITREAGVPEHRHKWVQCADSSTQDLLADMSDTATSSTKWHPQLFPHCTPYPSSTIMKRTTSSAVQLRGRYQFTVILEYHARRLLSLPILCASSTCSKQT